MTKTKRAVRILFFYLIIFLALFSSYTLLKKNLHLPLPNQLSDLLKKHNINLTGKINTRLLPFPHLYVDQLDMDILNNYNLNIKAISVYVNIFKIIQTRTIKITKLVVDYGRLDIKKYDEKDKRPFVPKLFEFINDLAFYLPNPLSFAANIEVRKFQVVLPDKQTLNFLDTKMQKQSKDAHIDLKFQYKQWLRVSANVILKSKANSVKPMFSQAIVSAKQTTNFDKMSIDHNFTYPWRGTVVAQPKIRIKFPCKKIDLQTNFLNTFLKINHGANIIDSNEEISGSTKITFLEKRAISKTTTIKTKKSKLNLRLQSNYSDLNIALQPSFIKLADIKNVVPYIKKNASFFKTLKVSLNNFYVNFRTNLVRYHGKLKANSYLKIQDNKRVQTRFKTNFRGNLSRLHLRALLWNFKKSKFYSKKASYNFISSRFKSNKTYGLLNLNNFDKSLQGTIKIKTKVNCRFGSNNIYCKKKQLFLDSKKIKVQASSLARFYRFLNINLFQYWKSLKKNSVVELTSFKTKAYIQKDFILIEKGHLVTDVGEFDFNGKWRPRHGSGELLLRLTPFNLNSVLKFIPVLGKFIQKSVEFATQMIFEFEIKENNLVRRSFTIGKGFKKIKDLIRK